MLCMKWADNTKIAPSLQIRNKNKVRKFEALNNITVATITITMQDSLMEGDFHM